jgi:hypothetical protein
MSLWLPCGLSGFPAEPVTVTVTVDHAAGSVAPQFEAEPPKPPGYPAVNKDPAANGNTQDAQVTCIETLSDRVIMSGPRGVGGGESGRSGKSWGPIFERNEQLAMRLGSQAILNSIHDKAWTRGLSPLSQLLWPLHCFP